MGFSRSKSNNSTTESVQSQPVIIVKKQILWEKTLNVNESLIIQPYSADVLIQPYSADQK